MCKLHEVLTLKEQAAKLVWQAMDNSQKGEPLKCDKRATQAVIGLVKIAVVKIIAEYTDASGVAKRIMREVKGLE